MPAYNAAATIGESIKAVMAQTSPDWELIIVDDASTDQTVKIAEAYKDSRIQIHSHVVNQGVAAARNLGMQHAKGEYIAFLDSDDLWEKDKLEKQVQFMQENRAVISYTGTAYIRGGKRSGYVLRAERELPYKTLLKRNIMSCSSVMVRRESMLPFPSGYMHEDFAVWLSVVRECGCAYGLDEPLLIYRMGEATKSSSRIKSAWMNWSSYREVGCGRIVSTIFMFRYAIHSVTKRLRIRGS